MSISLCILGKPKPGHVKPKPGHGPHHHVIHHHIIKIGWFRYAVRWYWFRMGKLIVRFHINAKGIININGKNIKLQPSKAKGLPAAKGWVYFTFNRYVFYVRFDIKHKQIFLFMFGGKCKTTAYGIKHYCGKVKVISGEYEMFFL